MENKENSKIYRKKWRDKHKDEIKNYNKFYASEHKEQRKEYIEKNYYRDKEKNKIYHKAYYNKNKDKLIAQNKVSSKIWRKNNKDKVNSIQNKCIIKRRKSDINFRILCNLRTRIWKAIKGYTKSLPTMMLIGCEIDYLLFHLQSQFTEEMNWDNYGKWEVDHIRPCSSFDLSKPEEQLKCFNYTNLQPLWKKDNLIKGAKWKND